MNTTGPAGPAAPVVALADLVPGSASDVAPEGDCDGLDLADLDLSGRVAERVRLVDCRVTRCRLDGAVLRRARVTGCAWDGVTATDLDAARSTWLDVDLAGCRVGALVLPGSDLARVRLRGGKVDYLNLRAATLTDVRLDDVVVGELDLGGATATRLRVDGGVGRLDVTGAVLRDVDLRGADLRALTGLGGLAGAVVSTGQLTSLAPALADHVGLRVLDG